jgi:hypothetical protein
VLCDDREVRYVANAVPLAIIGLLILLAAPLWPWSRGWGWAPAGILAVGLGTMLLFWWTIVPEG